MGKAQTGTRRFWTPQEDEVLRRLCVTCKSWNEVSMGLDSRGPTAAKRRATDILKVSLGGAPAGIARSAQHEPKRLYESWDSMTAVTFGDPLPSRSALALKQGRYVS